MNWRLSSVTTATIFTALFIGAIVSVRPLHIGTDTQTYIGLFHQINSGLETHSEPGFVALVSFFGLTGSSGYILLFGFLAAFTYFSMVRVVVTHAPRHKSASIFFASSALVLLSSWYITFSTNALRQGFALSLYYFGLFTILKGNRFGYIAVFSSVLFHFSSALLLFIPFILKIEYSRAYILLLASAILYGLGGSEFLVKQFSDLSGLPIYEFVASYTLLKGESVGLYHGFDLRFVAYTLFWPLLLLVVANLVARSASSLRAPSALKCLSERPAGAGRRQRRRPCSSSSFDPFVRSRPPRPACHSTPCRPCVGANLHRSRARPVRGHRRPTPRPFRTGRRRRLVGRASSTVARNARRSTGP